MAPSPSRRVVRVDSSGDSSAASPVVVPSKQDASSINGLNARAHRAVCVALPHDGKPTKIFGDNPSEFISSLKTASLGWVNFMVDDLAKDATEVAVKFGFSDSMVSTLLKGYHSAFEDRDTEMGIMVPAVKVSKLDVCIFPLLILIRKDLIVTIHSRDIERLILFSRYADVFLRKLPERMGQQDRLTMMLVRILDENNSHNFEHLREIEEQADDMSELLLDPETPRMEIGRKIYELKHALITYLNSLWRTMDVLHSLRYGDAELVTDNPKVLAKVGLLVEDVNRQISLSEHMSEVLASGLEVLQALYNNQLQTLNNRMALTMTWLTILGTAVLVPNTIATVIGSIAGMDANTLMWYITVLFLCTINATYLAYWWVKRWVRLPKGA
ncbi:MAG: CorA family divalent cation transporter [Candidatus Thermoplasmatota archaeon]|nr:CorA family divalent cation transporter [Candidatus Thermoplasmatota archaeon]